MLCYSSEQEWSAGKELGSGIVTIGFILQSVMFSVMLEQRKRMVSQGKILVVVLLQ